jgi:molecular chaperone GrpE
MKKDEAEDLEREAVAWKPPVNEAEEAPAFEEKGTNVLQLTQALEQKAREAAEAQDRYLRTSADFENYRKRMQRDLAEFRKYANEQLALEILSVVDHLGLALKHAASAEESTKGLREGIELVYKQFRDVLDKFGIKAFAAEGEQFDPAKHDAVMQEMTDKVPENTVVQVLQDGYLYYDKVLRHAKVSVARKPDGEKAEAEN